MLAWVIGVALIPPDAKLEKGSQQLARVLKAHAGQLCAAALLAVLGAVLLAGFFAVLSSLVRPEQPGWVWLRVSLAGCVMTQPLVAVGAGFALAAVHAAAGNAAGGLVALAWRGLWLAFLTSALPTSVFTATAVIGLGRAGLSPPWVSALGWLSAAAHLLAMLTLAQDGAFAPDGIIATLTRSPPSSGSSPWPPRCPDPGSHAAPISAHLVATPDSEPASFWPNRGPWPARFPQLRRSRTSRFPG
jgi:hypothetical protein